VRFTLLPSVLWLPWAHARWYEVKAGRFWSHLRAYLKHAPRKVGSTTLARKIRAAQWTYWHGKQNSRFATASMLRDLRS
jgi:hypothetical protein